LKYGTTSRPANIETGRRSPNLEQRSPFRKGLMQPSPLRTKYSPAKNISVKTKELKEEKKESLANRTPISATFSRPSIGAVPNLL